MHQHLISSAAGAVQHARTHSSAPTALHGSLWASSHHHASLACTLQWHYTAAAHACIMQSGIALDAAHHALRAWTFCRAPHTAEYSPPASCFRDTPTGVTWLDRAAGHMDKTKNQNLLDLIHTVLIYLVSKPAEPMKTNSLATQQN